MRARSGRAVRRKAGTAAADGAWLTPREDLLDSRAVGDAHEVDLGLVQITQDLVDVIGVDRGGGRNVGHRCHRFALR
jgi:hypothetical protein